MQPFMIRTVQGTDVIIAPPCVEAIAVSSTGCALYMASGAIWQVSETIDLLLTRLTSFSEDINGAAQ